MKSVFDNILDVISGHQPPGNLNVRAYFQIRKLHQSCRVLVLFQYYQ